MKINFVFWFLTVAMVATALSFLIFPVFLRQMKISRAVWLAAISVPSLAIALYLFLGTHEATSYALADGHTKQSDEYRSATSRTTTSSASVASLVTGLEEKLRADPGDGKGWLLLAKSYLHLGRRDEAVTAYAKAREYGQPEVAFELKLNGASRKENAPPVIHGRLTIDEAAAAHLRPDDSIFIFAKAIDGSAMPVAAVRKIASDLPFEFSLSDKQAMSGVAKLSSTKVVTIIARISRSGNAMQADPGLEVASEPIQVRDSAFVELHLGGSGTADSNTNTNIRAN